MMGRGEGTGNREEGMGKKDPMGIGPVTRCPVVVQMR
jgi:hypothetical protein